MLVVSHDPVLKETLCQGDGPTRVIREMTLAELKRWDCGSLRAPGFPRQQPVPGARIPTLEEVLALADHGDFHFNIGMESGSLTVTSGDSGITGSLFAGPVEYIHPRRRGDTSRLHGIVLGHVLLDVPQRLKRRPDRAELQLELEARAQGRHVVPITSAADIVPAVDAAVRAARGS